MESNKKYIMFFLGKITFGGAERVITNLTESLVNKGYKVEVLLLLSDENWYSIDEKVKITHLKGNNLFFKLFELRRYVNKQKPTVFISFLAPFNIYSLTSLLLTETPIVVAERNDPKYVPFSKFMRFVRNVIYKKSDLIVVQTDSNKKYFSKKMQKKIIVIPNPVKLKKTNRNKDVNKYQIISVGRLVEQKNHKLLIDAFKIVSNKIPKATLTIFGEGNLRLELESYIKNKELEEKVFLPGVTKNIHENIEKSGCFVLTSKFEGMPNALLEAMALGKPVISTKVSGARDIIQDKKNGLLVDSVADEVANAIIFVLSNDKTSKLLGKEAEKVKDELDMNKITMMWLEKVVNQYE